MKSAVKNPESSTQPTPASGSGGVGGRHRDPRPPSGGGGYRNIYSDDNDLYKKNFDARLAELKLVGLPRAWLNVAESIGIENFIETWRILDQHLAETESSRRMIYLPNFNVFLRYQRNRFITTMRDEHIPIEEIRQRIKKSLQETVSTRHISRILAKTRRA